MVETLTKLGYGQSIDYIDVLKFIKHIWTIENPNRVYDEKITQKVFSIGLGDILLKAYYNKVFNNPNKYGFSLMIISNSKGDTIKLIYGNLNTNE